MSDPHNVVVLHCRVGPTSAPAERNSWRRLCVVTMSCVPTGKQREDGGHRGSLHALQQDISWVIFITSTSALITRANIVPPSLYRLLYHNEKLFGYKSVKSSSALCPQSRPGAHHSSNEEVLRRQSLVLLTALSEQV